MKKYINISINYIKKYYLRSIAIALSIILSTILIVGIGSLSKSAKQAEVNIIKYDTGTSHVKYSNIDEKQLDIIKNKEGINKIAVTKLYDGYNYKDKVLMNLTYANERYLELDNGKIKEGKFPTSSSEIALEEWVIKNLDIKPNIGQKINLSLNSGKTKEFKLVGIIEDIPSKKSNGTAEGIVGFDKSIKKDDMTIYIEFNESINILDAIYDIKEKGHIYEKNVAVNTMLLDAIDKLGSIDWNSIIITVLVGLISGIVIYSVFNISIYQRISEYGVIRAIGGQKWQIFNLIFTELLIISIVSVPIGMVIGLLGSQALSSTFGQLFTEFEVKSMKILVSKEVLLLSVVVVLITVFLIALRTSRYLFKISSIEAIKKNLDKNRIIKKQGISVTTLSKFMPYHTTISFKNITKNKKSFAMIMVSITLGSILFIGSNYYAKIQEQMSKEKLEKTTVNYDYKIVTNGTLNMNIGLIEKDIKDIKNLKGIKDVNPTKIMYSRAIIDKDSILEPYFFESLEKNDPEWQTSVKQSKDKSSAIVQNNIWGYTDDALNNLNKFLVDGNIDLENMKKDNLVIVYVPTLFDLGNKKVVDIRAGDKIRVTFRKDGVISEEFYDMRDKGKYIEKEFKVAGIITNLPIWDDYYASQNGIDIILPEENFNKVCGFNNYRIIHANKYTNIDNENLFKEIMDITNRVKGITVRDLSQERVELQGYYKIKDSFVYIISIVLFIISMFNITNNVSYSLISRTKEFGMLRAVGLTDKEFKQIIIFEGLSYGILASILSIFLGLLCQFIMFKYFSIFLTNPNFEIRWQNYILIIFINILIGFIATYPTARKIKNLSVVESISSLE